MDFGVGDPLDCFHSFYASSEHGVLVVQPGLQEEIRKEKLINKYRIANHTRQLAEERNSAVSGYAK